MESDEHADSVGEKSTLLALQGRGAHGARRHPHGHGRIVLLTPADSHVEPLIQLFGLYLDQLAALDDMREPTVIASRAMRSNAMPSGAILGTLDGAVTVAATEHTIDPGHERVRALRDAMGSWLMYECFDTPPDVNGAPLAS